MGRQLRILIPGAVYHVTSRGNERKNIFRDDADRNILLKTLGEVKSKYDFKILGDFGVGPCKLTFLERAGLINRKSIYKVRYQNSPPGFFIQRNSQKNNTVVL